MILLTNDDGIDAPGLVALRKAFAKEGDVIVAAPDRPRSAASASLTLYEPVVVRRSEENGVLCYAVSGTPADSAKIAL